MKNESKSGNLRPGRPARDAQEMLEWATTCRQITDCTGFSAVRFEEILSLGGSGRTWSSWCTGKRLPCHKQRVAILKKLNWPEDPRGVARKLRAEAANLTKKALKLTEQWSYYCLLTGPNELFATDRLCGATTQLLHAVDKALSGVDDEDGYALLVKAGRDL